MTYGVQTWERVIIGNRIDTAELIQGGDEYFSTSGAAIAAAKLIKANRPAGVCRVTVGKFDENGEIEGEYIYDADL